MLDQTQDFLEMLRGLHPGCVFLYFVPVFAILTMAQYPTPAAGAIEFPVHRMNQIDLLGTGGCRFCTVFGLRGLNFIDKIWT